MKSLKVLLSWVVVMAIVLAISLPVSAIEFNAEEIYESVFVIYSGKSLGSGFSVGKNCIVTNAHVIDDMQDVTIKSYAGIEYKAFVLGIDPRKDIAVLGVRDVEFPYLIMAEEEFINIGDDIYAIGAPKSMAYTLTKGIISSKEREMDKSTYIQIDAAINEGNSGGPLLNNKGQVLGMNTLKISDSEGIGLAIPINIISEYIISLGLEIDESGNVLDTTPIQNIEDETPSDANDDGNAEQKATTQELSASTTMIFVIAVLSVIGNVVLLTLFILQKRKNMKPKYDPRERTNFEIDILE